MNAIPTRYAGVQFRSRLEARWAAFFDNLGWPWEYEPIDLAGYIPDFILPVKKPTLVEVKPALEHGDLNAHKAKVVASGWKGDAIIVGARIFPEVPRASFDGYYPPILGTIYTDDIELKYDEPEHLTGFEFIRAWHVCPLFLCRSCDRPTFIVDAGCFRCGLCGATSPSGEHVELYGLTQWAWREAGNLVQWKPE